jgi:hypothetical protein
MNTFFNTIRSLDKKAKVLGFDIEATKIMGSFNLFNVKSGRLVLSYASISMLEAFLDRQE